MTQTETCRRGEGDWIRKEGKRQRRIKEEKTSKLLWQYMEGGIMINFNNRYRQGRGEMRTDVEGNTPRAVCMYI